MVQGTAVSSSCVWSVTCACTCGGRIWPCDVLLLKLLFINITIHIKCAQRSQEGRGSDKRAYVRWASLTLLPLNSASLEASAVSCRQIRVVQQAPIWGLKLRVLPPPCPGSHSPPCFHGNEPVKATRLCLA